jgi:hypothetical protein
MEIQWHPPPSLSLRLKAGRFAGGASSKYRLNDQCLRSGRSFKSFTCSCQKEISLANSSFTLESVIENVDQVHA